MISTTLRSSNTEMKKQLIDYTNEELISYLDINTKTSLPVLTGILSEILRRMNENKPLLPKDEED